MEERTELYTINDCEPIANNNLKGKTLVLNPDVMMASHRMPKYQIWVAEYGFGCLPNLTGKSIIATNIITNEEAQWERDDFIGILKDNI